jgi:hypothetical protein
MKLSRVALWGLLFVFSSCKFETSCGNTSDILNTRKGEKVVGEWLEKQGMPATSTDCPRDVKIEKDMKFLCKAVIANANDLAIDVEITQTSDDGDIHMEHASKILSAEHVERGLAGQILDQTGKKVAVDCGLRVRPAVPKTTFTCAVAGEGENFQAEISIEDEDGAWQAKKL